MVIFVLCDFEIWQMPLENNGTPLPYYAKLCASFQSHGWIKTGVTVRKRSILVKISDFLSCVTLKFDGWLCKTIGRLFYTALSFVHHFKAICEFKLELQSGNTQLGSKSATFVPCDLEIRGMTLKNNRTRLLYYAKLCAFISKPSVNSNLSYSAETLNSGQDRRLFVPCDLEIIWRMTLKNNRTPLICCFKFCAAFHSYWSIQTGYTVLKRPIWVKIDDFF